MRHLLLVATLVFVAAPATAQGIEVGATIAAGCLGSDGSACGTGTYPLTGAHVSWWAGDRIELSVRVARVSLPPFRSTTFSPDPIKYEVAGRSRSFMSAMFVYHIGRGTVRPMLGLGSGLYLLSQRVRCDAPGCGDVRGPGPEGVQRTAIEDVILLLGLSGRVAERWIVRGGCLSHRFANDENSTIELFAGVGYRFGSR